LEVVIVFGLGLMNATMAGFFGLIFRRFRRTRRTSSLGKLVLDTILPADAAENEDNPLNRFLKSNFLFTNFHNFFLSKIYTNKKNENNMKIQLFFGRLPQYLAISSKKCQLHLPNICLKLSFGLGILGDPRRSKKFGVCKNQLIQQKKPVFVFFVFLEPKTDAVN
jgi:hypothetical protein